jgi:hypothetical protein
VCACVRICVELLVVSEENEWADIAMSHFTLRMGHSSTHAYVLSVCVTSGENEEDEQAAIEARRNRIAALKAKHAQQASVANPTAAALQVGCVCVCCVCFCVCVCVCVREEYTVNT